MGDKSNNQIFKLLFDEEEITWQSLLYNLIKTNEIDPWDVDVSVLSSKFMEAIGKLEEMSFKVSGKLVLAASLLVKIKSNKLISEDLSNFENMFNMDDDNQDGLGNYIFEEPMQDGDLMSMGLGAKEVQTTLIPRTPQPRERKVSIFDLVDALQKALNVKKRRVIRNIPVKERFKAPERVRDITEVIRTVYSDIKEYCLLNESELMTFNELLPSEDREDKIFTFLSLLHLTNERKVDMLQEKHFSPIMVKKLSHIEQKAETIIQ